MGFMTIKAPSLIVAKATNGVWEARGLLQKKKLTTLPLFRWKGSMKRGRTQKRAGGLKHALWARFRRG